MPPDRPTPPPIHLVVHSLQERAAHLDDAGAVHAVSPPLAALWDATPRERSLAHLFPQLARIPAPLPALRTLLNASPAEPLALACGTLVGVTLSPVDVRLGGGWLLVLRPAPSAASGKPARAAPLGSDCAPSWGWLDHLGTAVVQLERIADGTDLQVTTLNAAAERIEGWSRDRVHTMRITELLPHARASALIEAASRAFETELPAEAAGARPHTSPPRRDAVVLLECGAICWTFDDVRALAQVEASLRTERGRLRQVLDSTLVALLVTDLDGQVEYASPRASAMLCRPRSQLESVCLDQQTLLLHHLDGRELVAHEHPLSQVRRLGKTQGETIFRYTDPTGDRRLLRIDATPVVDRNGQVSQFVFTLDDVTEVHRRRVELERAERNLSHAQRLGAVGSWEVRPGTDGQWWSEEMFRLHGLDARRDTPDVGRLLEKVHASDRESFLQFHHRLQSRPGRFATEYRVLATLGTPRIVRAFGHHESAPGGRPSGHIVGFVQDITEQRRSEEAQRTARLAAESANRAKSEFLAVVSHELRTPLNAVRGFAELIHVSTSHDRIRGYARHIAQGADNLTAIIQDILDISSIEAGQLHLNDSVFAPRGIVSDVAQTLDGQASERGLTLKGHTTADVPAFVRGDPQRIRQVLFNLVGNAVKFTETGSVTVEVSSVVHANAPALAWTVTDTGIGIAADKLPHIFHAFQQVDSSLNRRFEGVGLGLSISKRLAELMGGVIEVDSTPGEGSTFRLVLPYEHASGFESVSDSVHPARPLAPGALPTRPRVLVVEDDPINTLLIAEVLKALPLDVTLTANGRDAVEKARISPYHAILMDVQLPGMNGLEATRAIRRLPPATPDTVIIGISAHALEQHRQEALAAGMDLYLTKPILPSTLVQELRTRLRLA